MPMLPAPLFTTVVRVALITPIVASVGDLLVIWPGHASRVLIVTDSTGNRLLRTKWMPEGELYGCLLQLMNDDVIALLDAEDVRAWVAADLPALRRA